MKPARARALRELATQRDALEKPQRKSLRPKRSHKERAITRVVFILVVILGYVGYKTLISSEEELTDAQAGTTQRHLLDHDKADTSNYPPEQFTEDQLANGAVILHVIGVIYMFVALAIVCDEYFVPALEVMYTKWGVTDDVAGATFMAAGGSAPELATSFIGTFIAQSDVGFGTIVGSAVFNILFVIGCCALAAKTVLELTWWPLFRDTCFYSLDLLCLVIFFSNGEIHWGESVGLLLLYFAYVTFMKFNEKVERFVKVKILKQEDPHMSNEVLQTLPPVDGVSGKDARAIRHVSFRSGALHLMLREFGQKGRGYGDERGRDSRFFRAASTVIEANRAVKLNERLAAAAAARAEGREPDPSITRVPGNSPRAADKETSMKVLDVEEDEGKKPAPIPGLIEDDKSQDGHQGPDGKDTDVESGSTASDADDDDDDDLLTFPKSIHGRIAYIVFFPLIILLYFTLPNCTKERWEKWYIVTFLGSILWIAVFAYGMVWWTTIIGNTAQIPLSIMGLTFLAAGTSVPDLISSVLVARQGLGDMAVSSSIGSNIFDVTVGLPLPWLIWSATHDGDPVDLGGSEGLGSSVVLLFGMLVLVIVTIALSKWAMTKKLGALMFVLYGLFLMLSLFFETGIMPTWP